MKKNNLQNYPSSAKKNNSSQVSSHVLYGYQPIREALYHHYYFKRLLIQKNKAGEKIEALITQCKALKIPFFFVERLELDTLSGIHASSQDTSGTDEKNHQGLVAELKEGPRIFHEADIFFAKQINKQKTTSIDESASIDDSHFILALDRLTDPHNLGAISRSAYFFGCKLIALENSHSAPINETTHKISSGASLLLPYLVVEKLYPQIERFKSLGYQIIASHVSHHNEITSTLADCNLQSKICLIIGSEADGIRPHLLRLADKVISISSRLAFNSLNASACAAILMHEIAQKQNNHHPDHPDHSNDEKI